jgi:hypothetical protein
MTPFVMYISHPSLLQRMIIQISLQPLAWCSMFLFYFLVCLYLYGISTYHFTYLGFTILTVIGRDC